MCGSTPPLCFDSYLPALEQILPPRFAPLEACPQQSRLHALPGRHRKRSRHSNCIPSRGRDPTIKERGVAARKCYTGLIQAELTLLLTHLFLSKQRDRLPKLAQQTTDTSIICGHDNALGPLPDLMLPYKLFLLLHLVSACLWQEIA